MSYPNNPYPGANNPFEQNLPGAPGAAPAQPAVKGKKDKKKGRRKERTADGAPKVTRRVIGRQAKFALLFALVATAVAFLALSPQETIKTYVVRTTEPVPALTEVVATQFEAVEIDPLYLEEGALSAATVEEAQVSIDQLVTSRSRPVVALAKGQQVRAEFFSADFQLATPLAADERLVSIQAEVASAVAGQVKPGDRIDIFAVSDNGNDSLLGLIVSDIEVVSVTPGAQVIDQAANDLADPENRDKAVSELLPTRPVPGIYVLRVNAVDAPRLLLVDAAATVYIALRGADAVNVITAPIDLISTLCGKNVTYTNPADAAAAARLQASGFCL
jgi:Flp pilus assembly protein CpaB